MYQAGTLSGNPLAMTAGITTLKLLQDPDVWRSLEAAGALLEEGVWHAARQAGIPIQQTRLGSMFTTFFSEVPPRDWPTVKQSDTARFGRYFRAMLENGIYIAPSQFEAGFLSTTHNQAVIHKTIEAVQKSMRTL